MWSVLEVTRDSKGSSEPRTAMSEMEMGLDHGLGRSWAWEQWNLIYNCKGQFWLLCGEEMLAGY